jgi:hypothetical protein
LDPQHQALGVALQNNVVVVFKQGEVFFTAEQPASQRVL